MALSKETLDQLLSGYMDGVLASDERARVERLLREDPSVAKELDDLRALGGTLREISAADSSLPKRPQLSDGFADRVLEAAVTRARNEGLRDEHPLIRLAEQPAVSPRRRRAVSWRVASGLAALAASIVIAVIAYSPENATGPGTTDLAKRSVEEDTGRIADPQTADLQIADSEMDDSLLAVVDSQAVDTGMLDSNGMAEETNRTEKTDDPLFVQREDNGPDSSASVSALAESPGDAGPMEDESLERSMLSSVLVLNVKRTEFGRASRAVDAAMRQADIDATSRRAVSEQAVSAVTDTVATADETQGAILFLEAPAKQLDRFIISLLSDKRGVESVGMSIVTDAPVPERVGTTKAFDPTTIRHENPAWAANSDVEPPQSFASRLGEQSFIPLDLETAALGLAGATGQSNGPDVVSRVFVLIR